MLNFSSDPSLRRQKKKIINLQIWLPRHLLLQFTENESSIRQAPQVRLVAEFPSNLREPNFFLLACKARLSDKCARAVVCYPAHENLTNSFCKLIKQKMREQMYTPSFELLGSKYDNGIDLYDLLSLKKVMKNRWL